MDNSKLPKSEIRKVEIVHIDCPKCGLKGITYYLAGDTYGILLGRTSDNQLAVLDSWKDKTFFDEVSGNVHKLIKDSAKHEWSDCFRKVIGFICDPSQSGINYNFTGKKVCPVCKSSDATFILDDPIQFDTITLINVSHSKWDALPIDERDLYLKDKLHEVGCI
jgi:hypothetical protein